MLLYGHDLDGVIPILHDTRQDVLPKLGIGSYLLFACRHTNMAFIDQQRRSIGFELLNLKLIRILRIPNLSTEYLRLLVLYNTLNPSRDALARAAFPFHQELKQILVVKHIFSQRNLPHPVVQAIQSVAFVFLPTVESSDQVNSRSMRGPLSEDPPFQCLVQSEIQISGSELRQGLFTVIRQIVFPINNILISSLNGVLVWSKPWVILY